MKELQATVAFAAYERISPDTGTDKDVAERTSELFHGKSSKADNSDNISLAEQALKSTEEAKKLELI